VFPVASPFCLRVSQHLDHVTPKLFGQVRMNHVDTVWPYWNLMDFTPECRPDRDTRRNVSGPSSWKRTVSTNSYSAIARVNRNRPTVAAIARNMCERSH
jgi:hypothetical protein